MKRVKLGDKKEEKTNKWRGLFGKIICILLSLVLWGYVAYEKNPKTSKTFKNIPVVLTNKAMLESRNMAVIPSDMYVSVKLTGERNVLAKVNKKAIRAKVDLSEVTSTGLQNPNVSVSGYPSTLGVERIKITSGSINVERRVKKVLDIKIDRVGVLEGSLKEVEKFTTPEKIEIAGPESLLQDVEAWTEPINLSSVKKSEYVEPCKVILKNANGEVLPEGMFEKSEQTVTVTRKYNKNKKITLTAPDITGSLPGYNVIVESIEPASVEVKGMVEDVELLEEISMQEIDAYDLAGRKATLKCDLIIPENISCDVKTVTLKLKYEKLTNPGA